MGEAKVGKGGKKRKDENEGEGTEITSSESEPKKAKATYKISGDIKKSMQADKQNSRLWKEVVGKEFINKKALTEHVEELVSCIICMELVFHPISTPCEHNVCKPCLSRSFKAESYSCPSYRADLGKDYDMKENDKMKEVLNLLFPGYEAGR